MEKTNKTKNNIILYSAALIAAGLLLNLLGALICEKTGLPLYLDTIGTILVSVIGTPVSGIISAFALTFTKGIEDHDALYYCLVGMIMAVCGSFLANKGFFKSIPKVLLTIPIFVVLAVIPDSIVTWFLYPEAQTTFLDQVFSDFKTELADKAITVVFVAAVNFFIPEKIKTLLKRKLTYQESVPPEMKQSAQKKKCRKMSINQKIILLISAATVFIAGSSMVISFVLFRDATINDRKNIAAGVTEVVASVLDPEMIDKYLEDGGSDESYKAAKKSLTMLRDSHSDIEYIYVYKIEKDGCHVVFDLDTEDMKGSPVGTVEPFDETFMDVVPDLLAGREIDPIISDDAYGWLLTVYRPVYDSNGVCQCYAAADVSMKDITVYQNQFLTKLISLFIGFFILVIVLSIRFVKSNIILPVNTMAYCAGNFAFNSGDSLEANVEQLKKLGIRTGDEIENLYLALVKTTEDSVKYVEDIKEKTDTISKMQNGLIMVLADLVESRDKCTGDHVKKTAAYAKIILNEMEKRGYYTELINEEFKNNVMNAAPLHDIGKIHISDNILNKPAKLNDDEYEIMKTHTTLGSKIIDRAIEIVPDSAYLEEAKNLSEYHHEKWNGKGYPNGIAGEDIPLSARIMAVADVFDALVSRRSYKAPFSFEKAMDIIKSDAGTHFDPLVVEAFAGASEQVRKVCEEFSTEKAEE